MKKIQISFLTILWGIITPVLMVKADWETGLINAGNFGLPNASIYDIIINFLEWLLMLFTILSVLAFVISGIMFLTAGANPNNAQKAKDMVTYSIIGIVVGLSGYIIIALIDGILLGNIW